MHALKIAGVVAAIWLPVSAAVGLGLGTLIRRADEHEQARVAQIRAHLAEIAPDAA